MHRWKKDQIENNTYNRLPNWTHNEMQNSQNETKTTITATKKYKETKMRHKKTKRR